MSDIVGDTAHEPYRRLLSARLDAPLDSSDDQRLTEHLESCARCRQVEHDYGEQRRLLQSLPEPVPPRDLWARTAAALDRELLRDARHAPRSSGQRGSALTALTTPRSAPAILLVSAASLTMATILLITQLGPALRLPDGGAPQQTAAAGGVALAFVDANAGGLTLYRTQVNEGCPNSAECPGQDAVEARVTFPASFQPSTLALAPGGDRLAIMGSDSASDNVFTVLVVPPLDAPGTSSDVPARPRPPVPRASAAASLAPGATTVATVTPNSSAAVSSPAPSDVAPAELSVSTILDGVIGAGAAPAWSADGNALAFSAMPSDGSAGPDIYVWQVGDARAHPITADHRSYFASWSGNTIVISRIDPPAGGALGTAPIVTTIAISLATHEQRVVHGPQLWLPQVDPNGQHAVGWQGQLAWDGRHVVAVHGALYMVDWAPINPFGAAAPVPTPTIDAVDMSRGGDQPMAAPPTAAGGGASTAPNAIPSTAAAATPAATVAQHAPIASDTPAGSGPTDDGLTPIEPGRDPLQHPVLDWRVMWSSDGLLLAEWIGDGADSTWGQLRVLAMDSNGSLDGAPVLAATPARRGFNLATNRIAWVAPSDGSPSGELRLRVWSATGVHDVRVRPVGTTGVVAAF